MRSVVIVAAGLLAMAAASPPRVELAVPFHVGETLTYDVSWSSFVTAGTAVARVEARTPVAQSVAYRIVAEGRPTPLVARIYALDYRMETLLDAFTLLPRSGQVDITEGSRHRTRTTTFDRKTQPLAQDALSVIYAVRAAALKPGAHFSIPVVDNGITYTVRFDVGALEPVQTPLGTMAAWRVDVNATTDRGEQAARHMALWVTADARRLPAKLQADLPVGSFSLMLRDVK